MNPFSDRRRRWRGGASALELALSLPLLLGMILATIDLGRLVADTQSAAAAAAAAADLASQADSFEDRSDPDRVTTGRELGVVNVAAREVARPLVLFENGALIISACSNPNGNQVSCWQRPWGRRDVASAVGPGTLHGVSLGKGEGAVFAEVAYRFEPFLLSGGLLGLDGNSEFRTLAVRRPRLTGPTLVAVK